MDGWVDVEIQIPLNILRTVTIRLVLSLALGHYISIFDSSAAEALHLSLIKF